MIIEQKILSAELVPGISPYPTVVTVCTHQYTLVQYRPPSVKFSSLTLSIQLACAPPPSFSPANYGIIIHKHPTIWIITSDITRKKQRRSKPDPILSNSENIFINLDLSFIIRATLSNRVSFTSLYIFPILAIRTSSLALEASRMRSKGIIANRSIENQPYR